MYTVMSSTMQGHAVEILVTFTVNLLLLTPYPLDTQALYTEIFATFDIIKLYTIYYSCENISVHLYCRLCTVNDTY